MEAGEFTRVGVSLGVYFVFSFKEAELEGVRVWTEGLGVRVE